MIHTHIPLMSVINFDNKCNRDQRRLVDARRRGKMRLDVDPFPVNTVGLEGKKILVQIDQAETT
jgi:hypothetical protein